MMDDSGDQEMWEQNEKMYECIFHHSKLVPKFLL